MKRLLSLVMMGLSLGSVIVYAQSFNNALVSSITRVPVSESKVSTKPMVAPSKPELLQDRQLVEIMLLSHGQKALEHTINTLAAKSAGDYTYLSLPLHTIDDAENYYAQIDPYVHPALNGVSLTLVSGKQLKVTGLGSLSQVQQAFEPGMQVRLPYVEDGVTKYQVRTISQQATAQSGHFYIHFDNDFNHLIATTPASFERLGAKYNLALWQVANNVNENVGTVAAYSNDADLGFGRRMVANRTGDDVAFYVSNYADAEQANDPNAVPVATVAMEYSAVIPNGTRQTQFYVFDNNKRLINIDLDGKGKKQVPGLCQSCHGNNFIAFDLDSFGYPADNSRTNQQSAFKQLNELILATNPTPGVEEMISLWYQNSNTQHSSVVPASWQGESEIYSKVIKPYCRTCHLTVGSEGPMNKEVFMAYGEYFMDRVCDPYFTMPHAKVTHEALLGDDGALSTLTERFEYPIECWSGTPVLSNFTHGSVIDLTGTGNTVAIRELHSTEPVSRFELQMVRTSDKNCLNIETGAVKGNKNDKACWQDMGSAELLPWASQYTYQSGWHFNPSLKLVNWKAGEYEVIVRAWGAKGQLSNTVSDTFEMQRPTPTVRNFQLTPTSLNKQQNKNVAFAYTLETNQAITRFERAIQRISDGQWITPNTANLTSYKNRWEPWSVLNLDMSSGTHKYSYSGQINPFTSYTNWQPGTYAMYVRAINADDKTSTESLAYFYITDEPVPPVIGSWWLSPNSMNKFDSADVFFNYSLTADQPVTRFERKIVRASDWRCINPATGQSGSCWHDYSALKQTGSSSGNTYYGASGMLNPSVAYANWNKGSYYIYVRGYNGAGQMSNQRYLSFRLQ